MTEAVVAFACVVIGLRDVGRVTDGWEVGPFPFGVGDVNATERERLGYFRARSARILFGGLGRAVRWHRSAPVKINGVMAGPLELLLMPRLGDAVPGSGASLLVVHVDLGDRPHEHLVELRAALREADFVADVVQATGLRATVPEPTEVMTLAYVVFDRPLESIMTGAYDVWPPVRQWLWMLASATSLSDYPPDPDDPELFRDEISFSASWRALVLRQGVAFVATRPSNEDSFLTQFAPAHVRTIYLDTMLLGLVQRSLLNQLSDEVAQAAFLPAPAATVRRLNRDLLEFRAGVWRQQITVAGHANQLLGAFQRQNLLPELLDASAGSIADLATNVQDESNLRTSAALGLIALVGFPLSLVLTGMQVLGVRGWASLALGVLVGGVGAVALVVSKPGREFLGPLPRAGRNDRVNPTL